jgi:hypothetical protein
MSRQMSAKERVLARKQARKEEEEAKRRAQLLAARKDYHAEKQQASLQKNNMYRGSHEQAAHQASSSPQPQQQQYQHQQEYYDSGNEEYDPTESTTSTSDEEEDEEDEEDIVLDEAEVLENEKEMRFLRTQLNEHTQYIKNLRNSIQIGQQVADVDHDPELDALHEEAEEEDEGYMSPPPAASGPIDPDPLMSSMTNPHLMQSLSSSLQSILSPMEDPSNDNVVYQSLSRPLPTFSNDRPTASSTTTTTTPTVSVTSQKQIESEMAVTINPNSSKMFTMSPYERLKLLTTDCVKQLGKKVFMQAYTYLRKVQEDPGFSRESDDRKVQADLTVILGKDRIHLWKMLDQIIFIEANC